MFWATVILSYLGSKMAFLGFLILIKHYASLGTLSTVIFSLLFKKAMLWGPGN